MASGHDIVAMLQFQTNPSRLRALRADNQPWCDADAHAFEQQQWSKTVPDEDCFVRHHRPFIALAHRRALWTAAGAGAGYGVGPFSEVVAALPCQ